MSIIIVGLLVLFVLSLSVFFLSKTGERRKSGTIFLHELKDMSSTSSPIIVSQIKGGEVQETLCYLPSNTALAEDRVMELDVRDALSAKLNPVSRFTAQRTI